MHRPHFRPFSRWSRFHRHSSSQNQTPYSPDSATKNRSGAEYQPLYQPLHHPSSYGKPNICPFLTISGAEPNPSISVIRPEPGYPSHNEFNATPYHYVNMNDRLNESFYEGCSNQSEAKAKHDAGIQETGMQGVKVLEPGMPSDNSTLSTMESVPRTRSPLQRSPRSFESLVTNYVSHGLPNLGNTCYMNSVLQCLFNIEKFRHFFVQGGHLLGKPEIPLTESFVELLSSTFNQNTTSGDLTVPITQFKDSLEKLAPVFEGSAQNDAHEFFRLLIQKMHDELNNGSKRYASYSEFQPSRRTMTLYQLADDWKKYSHERDNSMITSLFGGVLLNEVACSRCRHVSYTFEDALDLSLNLSNAPEASSSHSRVATTLYECLKRFTTAEPVEGYECEGCQTKNTSTKRTMVWKQPEVLVVQFKRFLCDNYGNRRALKERVCFPIGTMTLDYFTHEKSNENRGKFKLEGMVNHYGDLTGGHYIAYLYNEQMKCWLKYNDSQVTKVDEKEINEFGQASIEPYILFYKRI